MADAKRVLIACEHTATVREAFRRRGFDAWSCDLLPEDHDGFRGPHLTGDVRWWLTPEAMKGWPWDLLIAHPPCTYLSSSGLHWNHRTPGRPAKTDEALDFVRFLLDVDIPYIALENPIGCISTRIRKPDQIIQPWQFGADASKATCLWLKGLPKLEPTKIVPGRRITLPSGREVERWANQNDKGQNRLGETRDRWKLRSKTYRGIAEAMADQWGKVLL